MDETIYYNEDNVKVTNTQVMSEGRMHTLNSINSAQIMAMHHKRTAILFFGIMLSILSLGSSLYLPVFIFLGAIIFWFLTKPDYAVLIETNSGRVKAFTHSDKERSQNLLDAINKAIASRG